MLRSIIAYLDACDSSLDPGGATGAGKGITLLSEQREIKLGTRLICLSM
jgi:hypothetical protein